MSLQVLLIFKKAKLTFDFTKKMRFMKNVFYLFFLVLFLSSCVTAKKFDEQTALAQKYLADKKDCKESLALTENLLEENQRKFETLKRENNALTDNVLELKKASESLSKLAEEERSLKEKTNKDYQSYMLSASEKQEKLTQELAEKERILNKREADLHTSKLNLEEREKQLKEIKKDIFEKEATLSLKTKKIAELEAKLSEQANALSNLTSNVSKALKGFTLEELSVTQKEGKVYVSLSEKLLFKPGSFTLDKEGEKAIAKLAEVLKKQTDVDVIVEGHADSDPFGGKGDLVDNLDLSTKRATSVTRVLIKNEVSKEKIVAAGRGDAKPIASNETKEGKAKNRRTEIILSPNLEKLFELIQSK